MAELAQGRPARVIFARHPRLVALEQFWHRKRHLRWAPAKHDMDPLEMRDWLGNLMVLDLIDGGADFHYRLYGTNLVKLFGRELTGRRVSALPATERKRTQERLYSVARDGKPRHFRFELRMAKAIVPIAELVLPLSDDGERASHLLIGAYEGV